MDLSDKQLSESICDVIRAKCRAVDFGNAEPVPHFLVDISTQISPLFSDTDLDISIDEWNVPLDDHQRGKYSNNSPLEFPKPIQRLTNIFMWGHFLKTLETVTGIPGLIPDPHFVGGGLHLSLGGGILDLHTDFHSYERLNIFRRLNLLLYLNADWCDGDGGELELLDKHRGVGSPTKKVEPKFGTLLVFETNDRSLHGFTNPVGDNKRRLSLALYYYTSIGTTSFAGDASTHWVSGAPLGVFDRLLQRLSSTFMTVSRGFSLLAHLTNPRQGLKWLKRRRLNQNRSA